MCSEWSARAHTDTAAMAALRTISPRQCLDLLTVQGGISKIFFFYEAAGDVINHGQPRRSGQPLHAWAQSICTHTSHRIHALGGQSCLGAIHGPSGSAPFEEFQ